MTPLKLRRLALLGTLCMALAELHQAMVAAQGEPDLLFALAELSYLHGRAAKKPEYALAAAVYAYAFLFPEGAGVALGRTAGCTGRPNTTRRLSCPLEP